MVVAAMAVALIVKPPSRVVSAASENLLPPIARVEIGETKKLGDGSVCSWVRVDEKGEPTAIGITMTEAALNNLPKTGDRGASCCQNETLLHLPANVTAPFTHIAVNWNPFGHVPPGIYDKPHFDFHFYMMDESQRQQIRGDDANFAKAPPAETVPAGYIPTPGVMKMGVHWIDPKSPEFAGKPFTKTFLYGAYAGQVSFIEPMITRAYLLGKANSVEPIAQPKTYSTGVFPTHYAVKFDPQTHEYTIALEGLKRH
jgi:hypothetical protein